MNPRKNFSKFATAEELTILKTREAGLPGGIMVDCSHGNSQRRHESQPAIFHEVFDEELRGSPVRGLMVGSFLLEREKILYGASSVDGCLGWKASEALLRSAYAKAIEGKGDILSYKILLKYGDEVLASTQHKLWVEAVTITDE